ncbi:MAG: hypothetical protein R3B06_31245 [Kofleriaceae bacterium]
MPRPRRRALARRLHRAAVALLITGAVVAAQHVLPAARAAAPAAAGQP